MDSKTWYFTDILRLFGPILPVGSRAGWSSRTHRRPARRTASTRQGSQGRRDRVDQPRNSTCLKSCWEWLVKLVIFVMIWLFQQKKIQAEEDLKLKISSDMWIVYPWAKNLTNEDRGREMVALWVHRTVSSSGLRFILSAFDFLDPCGRCVRFSGVTDWSKMALQ